MRKIEKEDIFVIFQIYENFRSIKRRRRIYSYGSLFIIKTLLKKSKKVFIFIIFKLSDLKPHLNKIIILII